ncbi:Uncharacterized protein Fot_39855 [Forsythia ovata]|uniref:Uncharacterized protein n=1 Tax=Forsythia ovata TaxID=205694 RepID=A0ABD1S5T8_9LAMI
MTWKWTFFTIHQKNRSNLCNKHQTIGIIYAKKYISYERFAQTNYYILDFGSSSSIRYQIPQRGRNWIRQEQYSLCLNEIAFQKLRVCIERVNLTVTVSFNDNKLFDLFEECVKRNTSRFNADLGWESGDHIWTHGDEATNHSRRVKHVDGRRDRTRRRVKLTRRDSGGAWQLDFWHVDFVGSSRYLHLLLKNLNKDPSPSFAEKLEKPLTQTDTQLSFIKDMVCAYAMKGVSEKWGVGDPRTRRMIMLNAMICLLGEERKTKDLELPSFDLATLATATDNFSSENMIGEGGFGPVNWLPFQTHPPKRTARVTDSSHSDEHGSVSSSLL